MKRTYIHVLAMLLLCCGCAGSNQQQNTSSINTDSTAASATGIPKDSTVQRVSGFLLKELQADLPAMEESDRRFSFYAIDLDSDGAKEYIVKPESRYFCGTGGCTFFLLNSDYSLNSKFTVTTPPMYVVAHETNGWYDLALEGDLDQAGKVRNYIYLSYQKDAGSYPGNPSLISKSEVAPDSILTTCWANGEQPTMHSY